MFLLRRVSPLRVGVVAAVAAAAALLAPPALSATVSTPTPPESLPAAATVSGIFASPFQIAASQPLVGAMATLGVGTTPAIPAAGNQCNLYAQTTANSGGTTTHKAWVSCTADAPVQVEECPSSMSAVRTPRPGAASLIRRKERKLPPTFKLRARSTARKELTTRPGAGRTGPCVVETDPIGFLRRSDL